MQTFNVYIDWINAMNIHHLELFYHVARCGGISAAARGMSYGIQQPAISHQIGLLEKDLGVTLFERRPFALTAAGRSLYDFARSFFGHVDDVAAGLREGGQLHRIRIAASRIVLRDHLPGPLQRIRERFHPLAFSLVSTSAPEMVRLIGRGEIDLAISVLDEKLPAGFHAEDLATLTLALAVREDSPWRSAQALLKHGAAKETLIDLASEEPVSRIFHRELAKTPVQWRSRLELDSFDLLLTYVAHGFGTAVSLMHTTVPAGIRLLPLKAFPRVKVCAIWKGRAAPATAALIEELKAAGKRL